MDFPGVLRRFYGLARDCVMRGGAGMAALAMTLIATAATAQTETPDQTQAIPHAIAPAPQIIAADAPQALVERAENVPPAQVAALLLPALSGFIEAGELAAGRALAERLQDAPLSDFQRDSLRFHRARLAQKLGRHARAIVLLRRVEQSPAARLLLLADSYQALRRNADALATLLRRDALADLPGRAAGQARILDLVASLAPFERLLLRENPPDPAVPGWIALDEILRAGGDRADALRRWRDLYPGHPALHLLAAQRLLADAATATATATAAPLSPPRHIAMLLPLTSPFGQAAQAFYQGFMAAHRADAGDASYAANAADAANAAANQDENAPRITLHDIGADPALAALYYRAALADGADFVVGPLGRQAVAALLAGAPPELPTLVIGDVPAKFAAAGLYGISLSPEREAAQVAARAFFHGHRQAGILAGESAWGRRVASAFAREWRKLGGAVVENRAIPRQVANYSRAAQTLLGLDRSIVRERILTEQLGVNLEFTPRRRDDLDFLFLAAGAPEARLLVPHLRFFQAHDLPLYATSRVYGGRPDPATDADLDGIIFGDLRWMIDAAALPSAPAAAPGAQNRPPLRGDLARLHALGVESYRIIARLEWLRGNPGARHYGAGVDLSVAADGNARRHLTWARFERGLPLPLPGATAGIPVSMNAAR